MHRKIGNVFLVLGVIGFVIFIGKLCSEGPVLDITGWGLIAGVLITTGVILADA